MIEVKQFPNLSFKDIILSSIGKSFTSFTHSQGEHHAVYARLTRLTRRSFLTFSFKRFFITVIEKSV